MANFVVYELRGIFFGKHETSLCIKSEKRLWIPNDDVVACLKSQKKWLNKAVFGHMEHYNRSNADRCLNTTYFSYNHSSTNKSANLPKRQAIAGQRTVKLLLVLNDAHNPINNPTVQVADPRKQNTLLPGKSTTDRRIISHHDGDMFSSQWHTILTMYSSWNYGRCLVLSDSTNIPRLISALYSDDSAVSV